jgi:general secretion pathway protein G
MPRRRTETRRVFFPWERARGPLGLFGRAPLGFVLVGAGAVVLLVLVHEHEETLASVRATRAAIGDADRAVTSYLADHAGACPRDLGEVVAAGYARDLPIDAWGRPLRVTCPGRRDVKGFEVSSDGPDGQLGGLDRVE